VASSWFQNGKKHLSGASMTPSGATFVHTTTFPAKSSFGKGHVSPTSLCTPLCLLPASLTGSLPAR
jgi:hypothetical protein